MRVLFISIFVIFSISEIFSQEAITKNQREEKPSKNLRIAAIPYFNYSRTIDFSYGAMAMGFYKLDPKDSISPSTSTTVIGVYSTSKSYVAMVAQQFYFLEDTYRARLSIGTGTGNLQFYDDLYTGGQFIDYSNYMRFALLRFSRKIEEDLYLGISGGISNSRTEFEIETPSEEEPAIDIPLNFAGLFIQNDTRNNVNYPSSGHNIIVDFKNFGEWLGNENSFNRLELTYDYYKNFETDNRVLLARFYSKISFGDVPFIGQQTVGRDDIRGYSEGRYRDDQLYSIQAEYRYKFKSKFGIVGFGGFATVVPKFTDIFEKQILPGVGAGIRYRLLEKEKINIGIDVAAGRKDWSLSFRISDAFTR